jgi:hypothetical protein
MSQDAQRMATESAAALEVAERAHDRLISYLAGSGLSLALGRLDRSAEAAAQLARVDLLVQGLGTSLVFADWFAAARAEIALRAANSAAALLLAEQAVARARAVRGLYAEGLVQRVWGQALAELDPPRWDEAESHMRESLRLLDECGAALDAAQTYVVWAMLRRAQGDAAGAQEHLGHAARQFEASGITSELARARQLISEIQLPLRGEHQAQGGSSASPSTQEVSP